MVSVFGNGTAYMRFTEMNCTHCALWDDFADKCDLMAAFADAAMLDGDIAPAIAARMGWTEKGGIPIRCAEFIPEAKAGDA